MHALLLPPWGDEKPPFSPRGTLLFLVLLLVAAAFALA
jgi:hypothetical protein